MLYIYKLQERQASPITVIVSAETAAEAREKAAGHSGKEGRWTWKTHRLSTCKPIGRVVGNPEPIYMRGKNCD